MADNKKDLYCPACQGRMKKVFIPEYNHYLDICLDGCGGIYFDNRELEHFDEQHESIDKILEVMKGRTFKKVEDNHNRKCPVCGAKMVQNGTSANQNIIIDCCYSCGGKFLDQGELEALRQEYKNDAERSQAFKEYFGSVHGLELEQFASEYIGANKNRNAIVFVSRALIVLIILVTIALLFILK